jgi:hypothetical protein
MPTAGGRLLAWRTALAPAASRDSRYTIDER